MKSFLITVLIFLVIITILGLIKEYPNQAILVFSGLACGLVFCIVWVIVWVVTETQDDEI